MPIKFDKYAKFINRYHIILKNVVILADFLLNSEELCMFKCVCNVNVH